MYAIYEIYMRYMKYIYSLYVELLLTVENPRLTVFLFFGCVVFAKLIVHQIGILMLGALKRPKLREFPKIRDLS